MISLLVLYLVTGLLLVGLSLPLIYRKIPPNQAETLTLMAELQRVEASPIGERAGREPASPFGCSLRFATCEA